MSMASPTLRSSSTTVPRPSFSSWLTSMPLLPRTAETVTGTSNTASRSAAECFGVASIGASVLSSAAAPPPPASWLRSGRSTLSVAMELSFHLRKTAGNQGCEGFFDDGFAAFGAAAAPLDAAIGARHGGGGGDHQAAFITFLMGDIGQARLQCLDHGGRGPQGNARLADGLMHGLAQGIFHITRRQSRKSGGGDLPRHRQRQAGGFVPYRLDLGMADVQGGADGDGEGGKGAFDGFGGAGLGVVGAGRMSLGLEPFQLFQGQGLLLATTRGFGGAIFLTPEFGVEGELAGFGRGVHQYTSSSSPLPVAIMISPLLARSLATLTMRIWASSTSFRRTGPMASISSRRILPARSLMLVKKTSRRPSVAPFSARPSLSFSTLRSRVWIEPGSSLDRSSKVNISALMRSALSRERSSRAVMKRLSVWRSKLLKISAICS